MGLCKNIATNIGHFYLNNTDSECLNDEKNWKKFENDQLDEGNLVKKKDRIAFGLSLTSGFQTQGIVFDKKQGGRKRKVKICKEWRQNPVTYRWKCKEFTSINTDKKQIKPTIQVVDELSTNDDKLNNVNFEDIFEDGDSDTDKKQIKQSVGVVNDSLRNDEELLNNVDDTIFEDIFENEEFYDEYGNDVI